MITYGHPHPHGLLAFRNSPGAFGVDAGVVHVVGDIEAHASRVLLDVQVLALATTGDGESVAYAAVNLGVVLPGEVVPFEVRLDILGDVEPVFIDLYARCAAATLPCLHAREPPAPF